MSSSSETNESTLDDRFYALEFDILSNSSHVSKLRRLNLEVIKHEEWIKIGLITVSEQINLLLMMIFALMCYNWYLAGTQWLGNPYLLPEMECDIEELRNVTWSFEEKMNITNPKSSLYQPGCRYYNYNYYFLAGMPYEEAQEEITKIRKPSIVQCKKFIIINDVPKEISFVKDFNIICHRTPVHLTNFYAEIGIIIFGFSGGVLADMYGRRPVHNYCAAILCVVSFLTPLTKKYMIFALEKLITGGSLCLMSVVLLLIYSEICLHKYRAFSTIVPYVWFVVGSGQPSAVYKIIEVWRLRNLAFAFATTIILFSAVMFVPESPRFLITKRQFSKAWSSLEELGYQETRPQYVRNHKISYTNLKYQLEILSKPYLQYRLYIVLILNGIGEYFFYLFRNMEIKRLAINETVKAKVATVEMVLVIFSAAIAASCTKKTIICMYYILIALCFATTMVSKSEIMKEVGVLAGIIFAGTLYIIALTYTIDIFPTTHRATSVGFCISTNAILAVSMEMYHDKLSLNMESDYLNVFYCGLCMVCALIAVISPETNSDLPDKKSDLYYSSLSVDNSERTSVDNSN